MKNFLLPIALLALPGFLKAQTATDVFSISATDLKGTARFMSMGGAFGALGGDLSSLSQNPAGIGVYRGSELGFTLDLDCQNAKASSQGFDKTVNQTKFLLNNIGGVATWRINNSVFRNLNLGFTYNKGASFNRRYEGAVPRLYNSITNYMAGIANANNLTVRDVVSSSSFDPYNPNDGYYEAPWLCILGNDSHFIFPTERGESTTWHGLWRDATHGSGSFNVDERGGIDEYNIALGGNISDVFYWGMNFDIVNVNYTRNSYWSESLGDALLMNDEGRYVDTDADLSLHNYYNLNGTGFNYQLGFIVKPIQELRLGFAFHTPTWYNLTENFYAETQAAYSGMRGGDVSSGTNNGQLAYNDFSMRTPWKLTASVAGVIGGRFILSADYEWVHYHSIRLSAPVYNDYGYGDYWDDWDYDWDPWAAPASGSEDTPRATRGSYWDAYSDVNADIKDYYTSTNTLRLGAEFRVTPRFSVRAGYSFVSSPVKEKARDGGMMIATGLTPSYQFDNTTNYATCGLGYRVNSFYADLAYVYKHKSATYHAYTSDPANPAIPSPTAGLSLNDSQIVLSCGFRF